MADGVLLNYLPSTHVGESVAQVRKGGDAKIFAYVHAAVAELNERTANSARKDLFNYAMADGYARMFGVQASPMRWTNSAPGRRNGTGTARWPPSRSE